MLKPSLHYFFMGCLWLVALPGIALASPPDNGWQNWLTDQLRQHPQIITAKKTMDANLEQASTYEQPLYNPELETAYERNGDDNNYQVGLSQTIDLWDKRGVRRQQGNFRQQAARIGYQLALQQKTAEALQSIINYQASRDLADFAEKQEKQMNTLLNLVEKQQLAGDTGQADTELAFLNLSQRLNATAQAKANLRQVESRLDELFQMWSPEKVAIPVSFWDLKGQNLTAQELDQLPVVAEARNQYQFLEKEAQLAKLTTKAEPTIGISGGEDGDEDVVAISLSIPLNFRNNYQAEARAVSQQSAAARQNYRAVKRQSHFSSQAALATMREYRNYFERWETLMTGRGETSGELLEKQWNSGDMSTTEYLLALEQRTMGMIAGIELRTQFQQACVNWLFTTGQLSSVNQHGSQPNKDVKE